MLEILKRIKADVSELKADGSDLKAHMERVERLVRRQIRNNAGMLVMMRATAGAFDERVGILKEDMRQIKDPIALRYFPKLK